MLSALLRDRVRQKLLSQTTHPAMRQYLSHPMVKPSAKLSTVEYLAVDLEMSGLNAKQDHIVSLGFVPIANQQIIIGQAVHQLVYQPDIDLQASAPIHNIRNLDLAQGIKLHVALEQLLAALRGKVLLLHHAPLDMAFLNQACRQLFNVELLVPTIDTLQLERRLRRHQTLPNHGFRLHACRERYGLPEYTAHNAVTDAIATAELWLAQVSHSTADKNAKIGQFL